MLRRILGLALALVLLAAGLAWLALWLALPRLDGELDVAGLDGPAVVERDALGVVTVRGENRRAMAFATGFAHAQDRYFQMDLLRRQAAGELSGLFGAAALPADEPIRRHRFRDRAEQVLARLPDDARGLLEAYAAGANAALEHQRVRPFEYWIAGAEPAGWRPEDCLLVLYAMFLQLNDADGSADRDRGRLATVLPDAVLAFLYPTGTEWDAPVTGDALPVPPVPSAADFDARRLDPPPLRLGVRPVDAMPGSNSWAVGSTAGSGRALLANDMHLPLRVPNIFYRLRLAGAGVDATGVSLPGLPALVAGSNGRVAWGFTNSYGDWTDVVVVERHPEDPERYRGPGGWEVFRRHEQRIAVAGGDPAVVTVTETIWGPVIGEDADGRLLALKWLAHEPEAVNLALAGLERATSVPAALDVAATAGMPPQNFLAVDAAGNLGWTIAGRIPVRSGYDSSRPADWSRPGTGWTGWLDPSEYPRVMNPPDGRLWTANARVAGGRALERIADGGFALGARAGMIRDGLRALDAPDESDMLAIQLDDRALFYERWRKLALDLLDAEARAAAPGRDAFARALAGWVPRAVPDSVGFRLVFEFREAVLEDVFETFLAALPADEAADPPRPNQQLEGPAWALVSARPAHLVNPRYDDWNEQLMAAVDRVIERAGGDPTGYRWGGRNQPRIRHPLSSALPLGWLLDMPDDPLPGAVHMPRVQLPGFGPSERFAVSPGQEERAYLHMPGGQSGHPLSPFYRAGHAAWAEGRPASFLPGEPLHRLRLRPGG